MIIRREDLETGRFRYTDSDIDAGIPGLPPVHPGEILRDEFLKPLGITAYRLAADIHVPSNRVSEMVHGRRAMTADTALRLGRYFGNTPAFWMHLQSSYDLATADAAYGEEITRNVSVLDRHLDQNAPDRKATA